MMRVGLDIGGTKVDAVVVDSGGHIAARTRLPSGWGPDALVATVGTAVRDLAAAADLGAGGIASVGIAMPGQIEPGSAIVRNAVNLGIDELDLGAALAGLDIPLAVGNDVNAAALGAYALRGDVGTLAYLNVGTGVAAGLVDAGRLRPGRRGIAGEIGHVSVDPRGPQCRCGQRGCIEAFAGGGAIARRWGRPADLPVLDVFDAADAGDALARKIRDEAAWAIASAVRILALTTDVDLIVLGGGVVALGDRMLSLVCDDLERGASASPFIRSLRLTTRLECLPPGSPAAALGAALVGSAALERNALAHG